MPNPFPADPSRTSSFLIHSLRRRVSLGCLPDAVSLLPLLSRHGLRPPLPLLSLLLSRCLRSRSPAISRQILLYIHATGLKTLYPFYPPLSNQIICVYFRLNRPDAARQLFDKMPQRNVFTHNAMLAGYSHLGMLSATVRFFNKMPIRDAISWNTVITAFAHNGLSRTAIDFYRRLRRSSSPYNQYTFSGLITACIGLKNPQLTWQVHGQLLVIGLLSNLVISSSMVDAYAKCECMDEARRVFDGMCERDVRCWTTLVHGYAMVGDLETARKVFDGMTDRNSVSWTALISGYTRSGLLFEALELFGRMVHNGLRPDQFTFSSGLCASAALGSIKYGKQIHARLVRSDFCPNSIVISSLMDMYSKCGDLEGGKRAFGCVPVSKRDSVIWNTMISASGQHGEGRYAIRLFREMVGLGNKPNADTFVVLLSACSESGLVAEGVQLFELMSKKYGIVPKEDHSECLVDLLGRAGHFGEALCWLKKMPCGSSAQAWNALLRASRKHKNIQLGKEVAYQLIDLDPQCSVPYLLLLDIYAELGNWESVEKIRHLMEKNSVTKEHASSWIEIDNIVHSFRDADQLHPSKEDAYDFLKFLVSRKGDDSFKK